VCDGGCRHRRKSFAVHSHVYPTCRTLTALPAKSALYSGYLSLRRGALPMMEMCFVFCSELDAGRMQSRIRGVAAFIAGKGTCAAVITVEVLVLPGVVKESDRLQMFLACPAVWSRRDQGPGLLCMDMMRIDQAGDSLTASPRTVRCDSHAWHSPDVLYGTWCCCNPPSVIAIGLRRRPGLRICTLQWCAWLGHSKAKVPSINSSSIP